MLFCCSCIFFFTVFIQSLIMSCQTDRSPASPFLPIFTTTLTFLATTYLQLSSDSILSYSDNVRLFSFMRPFAFLSSRADNVIMSCWPTLFQTLSLYYYQSPSYYVVINAPSPFVCFFVFIYLCFLGQLVLAYFRRNGFLLALHMQATKQDLTVDRPFLCFPLFYCCNSSTVSL